MPRGPSRRRYLRAVGGAVCLGGLAAPAAAADCGATVYANATEDGDPKLEVPSGEATITGQSTCEPGTELLVNARDSGGTSPFSMSALTTVGDTGGWSAAFDFESLEPGRRFEVTVVHDDGETVDTLRNCEVVADAPGPASTPSERPTRTGTGTPHPPSTRTATRTDARTATTTPPLTTSESRPPSTTVGHETPTTVHTVCEYGCGERTPTPTVEGPAPGASGARWGGWARLVVAPAATLLAGGTVGLLAVVGMLARWRLAADDGESAVDR